MCGTAARVLSGCLLSMLAAAASGHGGHEVPPGMSPQSHLHLFDGVIAAPGWLLVLALAAVAVVIARRRACRSAALRRVHDCND